MKWTFLRPVNNFKRVEDAIQIIEAKSNYLRLVDQIFVDASTGAIIKYLPSGNQTENEFLIIKTDSSGNTVTIIPFGTQLILATTSLTLASQGDSAHLVFDQASQTWWLK